MRAARLPMCYGSELLSHAMLRWQGIAASVGIDRTGQAGAECLR